jgi:hypothetical protein
MYQYIYEEACKIILNWETVSYNRNKFEKESLFDNLIGTTSMSLFGVPNFHELRRNFLPLCWHGNMYDQSFAMNWKQLVPKVQEPIFVVFLGEPCANW